MSKFVRIAENDIPRDFPSISKLVTKTVEGGEQTWVPEDEAYNYADAGVLSVEKNGDYKPEKGKYYKEVDVDVKSKIKGQLIDKTFTKNGEYKAKLENPGASDSDDDDDSEDESKIVGYRVVDVQLPFEEKRIEKEGVYSAADDKAPDGTPYQGFSKVTVVVGGETGEEETPSGDVVGSLIERKITANGYYYASDEKDADGDTAAGYSKVVVNVAKPDIYPSIGFKMKVIDFGVNQLQIYTNISIMNTLTDKYDWYEKKYLPVVDFSAARIEILSSVEDVLWALHNIHNVYDSSGNEVDKGLHGQWVGSGNEIVGPTDKEYDNGDGSLMIRKAWVFSESGTEFYLRRNGTNVARVSNISFSKGEHYSYTVLLSTQ